MPAMLRGPLGWLIYVASVFATALAVLAIVGEDDKLPKAIVLGFVVGTFTWFTSRRAS
jgi:hypothetical protein